MSDSDDSDTPVEYRRSVFDTAFRDNKFVSVFEKPRITNLFDNKEFRKKTVPNMANLSLKMIEKLMPSYGGETDVRDYLNQVQNLYDQCPNDQRVYFLLLAKYKLTGSARELIAVANVEDFNAFKLKMTKLFSPDNVNVASQDDFAKCTQNKGETVQNFAARVQTAKRRLVDQLPAAQANVGELVLNSQALGIFISGLLPHLKGVLKFRNARDFDEAVRIAKTEESYVKPSVEAPASCDLLTVCAWCKKPGHFVSNCLDLTMSNFSKNQPSQSGSGRNFATRYFQGDNFNRNNQNVQNRFNNNRGSFRNGNYPNRGNNSWNNEPLNCNNHYPNFDPNRYNGNYNSLNQNPNNDRRQRNPNFRDNNKRNRNFQQSRNQSFNDGVNVNNLLGVIDDLNNQIQGLRTSDDNTQNNESRMNTLNAYPQDLPAGFLGRNNRMAD